jgi:hypothetical protein
VITIPDPGADVKTLEEMRDLLTPEPVKSVEDGEATWSVEVGDMDKGVAIFCIVTVSKTEVVSVLGGVVTKTEELSLLTICE